MYTDYLTKYFDGKCSSQFDFIGVYEELQFSYEVFSRLLNINFKINLNDKVNKTNGSSLMLDEINNYTAIYRANFKDITLYFECNNKLLSNDNICS